MKNILKLKIFIYLALMLAIGACDSTKIGAYKTDVSYMKIMSHTPANNEINVPIDKRISIVFQEPISDKSLSNKTIEVYSHNEIIQTNIIISNNTIYASLKTNLKYSTKYTVKINKNITNTKDLGLQSDYIFYFTSEDGTQKASDAPLMPSR